MNDAAESLIVGVTGHRDLRPDQIEEICTQVHEQLNQLMHRANGRVTMLCSMAVGADTICAQEALKLGVGLVCPLPMPLKEYESDFTQAEWNRLQELLNRSENYFSVSDTTSGSRDLCYRLAGEYVVDHCQLLLALWDGDTTLQNGVGTAAMVHYALTQCWCDVLQITVGRQSTGLVPQIQSLWLRRNGKKSEEQHEA